MKITIKGDPRPMGRPRVVKGHVYYQSTDIAWRELIQWTCCEKMRGLEPLTCPLKVEVKFYRPYNPASKSYGDVDNLLKGLFDGMNGIVFKDDSQILKVVSEKLQDVSNPRCEVELQKAQGTSG